MARRRGQRNETAPTYTITHPKTREQETGTTHELAQRLGVFRSTIQSLVGGWSGRTRDGWVYRPEDDEC